MMAPGTRAAGVGRLAPVIGTVVVLAVLNELLARLMGAYAQRVLLNIGIAITMAVSLNLINGIAGSSRWGTPLHGSGRL